VAHTPDTNETGMPGRTTAQGTTKKVISQDEDGRSKEWQDRARVNLEEVPEGTKTILERDFEPEQPAENNSRQDNESPAY